MGSTCCADRSTETGVQERPQLWCVVLTQQPKSPDVNLASVLGEGTLRGWTVGEATKLSLENVNPFHSVF